MENLKLNLLNRVTSQKSLKVWVKAVFWCIIYILFVVWVDNYLWIIGLPIVFDVFITKFVPWTWWKKSKNKTNTFRRKK